MPMAATGLAMAFLMAPPSGPAMGDSIPTLSFTDTKGKTVKLDAPGMLYFVTFWSPDCAPCRDETTDIEQLSKEFEPSKRIQFVTVLWTEGDGFSRISPKDAKRAGLNLPIYMDPKNWSSELAVDGIPTKFLIRDSKILRLSRGADERPYDRWKWLIGRELEPDEAPKAP
jgi:thiol-disulfide isomerase/thioredoxin